jgi:hypothetical protein
MADTVDTTFTLAGITFTIGALTLRQSCDLRIGDDVLPPQIESAKFWAALYSLCIKTIAIAVRESSPETTEEVLWKLTASEEEMAAARKKILIHAGFMKADPTVAELRAQVAASKIELEQLQKTLEDREAKAKITGEELAVVPAAA